MMFSRSSLSPDYPMKKLTSATPSHREGFNPRLMGYSATAGAALLRSLLTPLIGAAAIAFWAMPGTAYGQIFVSNAGAGTIGEYNLDGTAVNAGLIGGLLSYGVSGIAVSGSNLFVVSSNTNTIREYTTSGATVNTALISGLSTPTSIAVSGSNLFVTNFGPVATDYIAEYTTSGATVNASLISGPGLGNGNGPAIAVSGSNLYVATFNGVIGEYTTSGGTVNASLNSTLPTGTSEGIVVFGSNLFVTNYSANTIGEYNAVTGAVINASFISGLSNPWGLAVSGSNLFVTNSGNGTIGEYNAVTGAVINASLVSGLSSPGSIVVVPLATHFSVSAPATAATGSAFNVTVTALDASNNTVTGYSGTVQFTSSDSQAVLPTNTTLTNGAGTFSVTLKTAGTQTVTATDTVTSSITGTSNNITVSAVAGPATHFSVSAPSSATAGTAISVTVTALDGSNATATGYSGTLNITSSDNQLTPLFSQTLTNGVGTFSVIFRSLGTQTVTATDTVTSSITGISGSIYVTTPPTHFEVFASGSATSATAGTALNFQVNALDSSNALTGYTGTMRFTSTDGSASLPANTTLTNGTGTFSVTFKTAGYQTITATDTVTSSITGTSNTITVSAGPATHFSVSAPASAAAGTAFILTVTALDAYSNTATGYTGMVKFTSTDGQASLPANTTLTSGAGTVSVTLKTVATQTVTATDTVTSSITGISGNISVSAAGPATHFSVSAPSNVTAGAAFSVKVTALDANNDTAIGYSGMVHFTSSDSQAVLPANTALTSGVGTFSVTLKNSTPVTPASVTATDTVTSSIAGTANINVFAGPATHFLFTGVSGTANLGAPFSFTVEVVDSSNNTITGYSGTVHFTSSDSQAVLPANTTLTYGMGTFSATLYVPGTQTITATDAATPSITGTSGNITVGSVYLLLTVPTTAALGTPFTVKVTALTATGNTVATGYSGAVHFTSSDSQAVLPANTALTNGTGTFSVTLNTGGTQTITATDAATLSITGTSSGIALPTPAPTNLTATAGNGQVSLAWYPSNGATSYNVYRSNNGSLSLANLTFLGNTGNITYTDTGLNNGITYYYAVIAVFGGSSLSAFSNVASATPELSLLHEQTFIAQFGSNQGTSSVSSHPTADATAQSGSIAAVINANGVTGTLVGYISSLNAGFAVNITLDANGNFTAATTALTGGSTAGQNLTITGQLANGVLSGTIQGLGLSFSATVDPPSGSSATTAGLYQASTAGSPGGVAYSIVGTQGEVFVLAVTSGIVAAGTGTVSASGAVAVQTTEGAAITGTLSPNATSIAGTITLPAGGTVSFTGLSSATTATNRLVNCSLRGQVTGPNILIEGFVIAGSTPKNLLLRAVGPGLTTFGLTGVLTNPDLHLFDSNANVLLANSGWGGGGTLAAAFAQTGAFPLATSSADAAAIISLQPGAYTTQTSNAGTGGGGVALAEIYDLNTSQQSQYPRLVNMSGRGLVGTGSNVLIAGFVIEGNSPETLLIRGVGPGLGQFGVTGTISAPLLSVYGSNGNMLAQNQSWGTPLTVSQGQTAASASTIAAAAASVGAFSLAAGSNDSALILNLAPGAYTAQLSGVNGVTGTAMIEIYELPPSQ
jgi:hypothetical protein